MQRAICCALICVIFASTGWSLPAEWQRWVPDLTRQDDFYEFWGRSSYQSALASIPPGAGTDPLAILTAGLRPVCHTELTECPSSNLTLPILHLTDWWADDDYLGALEGKVTLHVTLLPSSMPGGGWIAEGPPDAATIPLRDAVVTARQALRYLMSQPDVRTPRIGIIGEGLGGAVALALGALEPDLISFIAIHEPVPGFHFRKRGIAADSSVVLQPVEQMAMAGQISHEQLRCVLSYFDFFNFAPDVKSRTLVSMSLQDPVATTQQILAIYNHLGGPRQMVVQDTPGHLAVSDREHFYRKTYQWLEDLGWVRKPTVTARNEHLAQRSAVQRQLWSQ